jgi:hypothetical protein
MTVLIVSKRTNPRARRVGGLEQAVERFEEADGLNRPGI